MQHGGFADAWVNFGSAIDKEKEESFVKFRVHVKGVVSGFVIDKVQLMDRIVPRVKVSKTVSPQMNCLLAKDGMRRITRSMGHMLIDQFNATGRCDLTNFSDTDLIIQCLDAGG